jgi:hypothetical protein
MRKTLRLAMWVGGTSSTPAIGRDIRPTAGLTINLQDQRDIITGMLPAEARSIAPTFHKFGRWSRQLRPEIYDELLKLPLRFKLHPFDTLQKELSKSAVCYAPPLGPADPDDVIPFHVHRNTNGLLPGKIYSYDARKLLPAFYMEVRNVEGDFFRFEEELIKIFPTKKTFVRHHCIYILNSTRDARMILHHWLLGLGF